MILEHFKVPPKDRVLVSEAALRRTVTQIFEKLSVSPKDSAEGADMLTMTDLRGVETHGVSNMLRAYVRDFKAASWIPGPIGGWCVSRPPLRCSHICGKAAPAHQLDCAGGPRAPRGAAPRLQAGV